MLLLPKYREVLLGARALQLRDARYARVVVVEADTEDDLFYRVRYDAGTSSWGGVDEQEFEYGSFRTEALEWQAERTLGRIRRAERTLTLRFGEKYLLDIRHLVGTVRRAHGAQITGKRGGCGVFLPGRL